MLKLIHKFEDEDSDDKAHVDIGKGLNKKQRLDLES